MGRPGHVWFRKSRNRWYFKAGGKMHDGGPDKTAAEALRARVLADLGEVVGELVGKAIARPASTSAIRAGTVAELVPAYLGQLDVRPKTVTDYRCNLGWLVREFGGVSVADLDAEAVAERLRASGRKANTRRQISITVGAFVRWCRRDGFKLKKPLAETRGDEFILTVDEARKLLAVATGDFRPFLQTLWLTGCRPSEARALTCENVNWSTGVAVLREHKTARKTGKPRVIPFSPEALAVLEVQRQRYGAGHLFRSVRGNPYSRWACDRMMKRARAKAGVRESCVCYGYRHTFAATLVREGVSTARVAAILGHTSSKLVETTYGHLGSDMQGLRQIAAKVTG
jgi:integrase